jgi:hypothetical protein
VPADPSSPIPAALTHLARTDPVQLQDADAPHLLTYLAAVPDPRAARGRRHPLVAILGLAAAAVLAGARSIAAIAEWAADAPQPVRAALGARRDAPGCFAVPAEATIRRTLTRLDVDVLAGAIGAWLADQDRPRPVASRWQAVAVDGKTLRGARIQTANGDDRPVHLLAAMDHTSAAPPSRRHLRRGRLPGPHRRWPQRHGLPTQPGHRRAVPGGAGQHRRRAMTPRPRPTPTTRHPRDQIRMKPTSRQNDGALGGQVA